MLQHEWEDLTVNDVSDVTCHVYGPGCTHESDLKFSRLESQEVSIPNFQRLGLE